MCRRGYFGRFGGQFVPETLLPALMELEEAFLRFSRDRECMNRFRKDLVEYSGRPTPLYPAKRLTEDWGGPKVYLKREDLNHTGAHKINNTLGQILLAQEMGKERIIAETGAGQHGVAVATVAARFGLQACIYMGGVDVERQARNVDLMHLLGAEVIPVQGGSRTLKDATNEAIRDWVTQVENTYYIIGSVVGPHPYPTIVRTFQRIIGEETREQILEQEGSLPHSLIACVGGGSNAIGFFHAFLEDEGVTLYGVEAGGEGLSTNKHAATLSRGREGIFHGFFSYLLQDEEGQILPVHSISAGLDYPGVGPEHGYLYQEGRARYVAVTDREALSAFQELSRKEGIVPALESAHALAFARKKAREMTSQEMMIVNLSGRGDKDMDIVRKAGGFS